MEEIDCLTDYIGMVVLITQSQDMYSTLHVIAFKRSVFWSTDLTCPPLTSYYLFIVPLRKHNNRAHKTNNKQNTWQMDFF